MTSAELKSVVRCASVKARAGSVRVPAVKAGSWSRGMLPGAATGTVAPFRGVRVGVRGVGPPLGGLVAGGAPGGGARVRGGGGGVRGDGAAAGGAEAVFAHPRQYRQADDAAGGGDGDVDAVLGAGQGRQIDVAAVVRLQVEGT